MKKLVSILLVCLLLCTAVPLNGFAAGDAMKVVVSLEGFTLGKGYFMEPTEYTVSQINNLIAKDGFGPYTEDTLTAGMAVLAMLNDNSLGYEIKYGTWEKDGYLDCVKGIDNGNVNFPAVITANGGPSNDKYTKNTDKDLGTADYTSSSGWMFTVNNESAAVGMCNFILKSVASQTAYSNVYVIRFQYTLIGYGCDLGLGYDDYYTGKYVPGFFTAANKDQAMIAYAESGNTRAKAKAKPVLEKLDATQAEVDAVIEPLGKAETVWDRILNFFDRILAFFKNLFKIG